MEFIQEVRWPMIGDSFEMIFIEEVRRHMIHDAFTFFFFFFFLATGKCANRSWQVGGCVQLCCTHSGIVTSGSSPGLASLPQLRRN